MHTLAERTSVIGLSNTRLYTCTISITQKTLKNCTSIHKKWEQCFVHEWLSSKIENLVNYFDTFWQYFLSRSFSLLCCSSIDRSPTVEKCSDSIWFFRCMNSLPIIPQSLNIFKSLQDEASIGQTKGFLLQKSGNYFQASTEQIKFILLSK